MNRTYLVNGMTCDHCVSAVRNEVTEVAGVDDVAVDLATKQVVVTGSAFDDDAVLAAVDEAGYQAVVVGPEP